MGERHESLEDTLRRLKEERDAADRRYNEALTALDQSVFRPPELPAPHPAYDEQRLPALNEAWNIIPAAPTAPWPRRRMAGFIWRLVAPYFERQLTFNSTLVDHLNRNVAAHREVQRSAETVTAAARDQVSALILFQSRLIQYLQQITAYVDTRDRDAAGQALIVNAAVDGLAEAGARRWESMVAREQRYDAKVATLSAAHDELRTLISVSQQASLAMKRELERMLATPKPSADAAPAASPERVSAAFSPSLDAYKYVAFEDQFRGSQETIRARLESYLPYFEGASNVLDVGCGRGEFLDLLGGRGIRARGLDLNHEMVEVCRARGLDVTEADVVSFLDRQPDGSVGGLFAAQVVEHLQPSYLLRFLELAHHKLRPGAPVVLETLNPACWTAFFDSFIRDITHVWPLHPDTLRYLTLASGFSAARIEYRSPVPPQDRLQGVVPTAAPAGATEAGDLGDLIDAFNGNVEKLNGRLFTYLDYAIVGAR